MRISIIKSLSLCFILAVSIQSISAQKFGYVNSTQILAEHPEIKAADTELEAYQKQLVAKGEQMVKSFEQKYTDYMTQANGGTLSQVQMQQKETELGTEQQAIQQYEVEVQNKLLQKRQELYAPVLNKINSILESLGKEGGYTMIFDSSTGGLLHADESEDVTTLLRQKLGM